MFSIPVPFTTARLDLELPLAFLPTFARIALLLIAGGATLALIAALYRAELRRVGGRTARALLALRLATVVSVFTVFATHPIVVRTRRENVPGRVLLAVDLSDSMRVNDPDRPLADKLRLALALRLYEGVSTRAQVEGWIADAEQTGPVPPDAAVEQVRQRTAAITRLAAVERALAADGAALLDRLKKHHPLEVVGFTQTHTDLPPDAAFPARATTPAFTDLKLPLARADRADPPTAVVLFTDGRHNWGEPPAALAQALAARGVAIFPVNVAPRDPPADVAVVAVRPAVATICRGSSVPVAVEVRATRWPPGKIEVSLNAGSAPLTQTVPHDGTDRVHEVIFHPRFEKPGPHTLTAEAHPNVPDPRPENNVRSARVAVVDYKPRVLLIDGEARWEFRYLRSALLRSKDPELEVQSVVFRQPRIGSTPDAEATKAGLPLLKLPDDEDTLAAFDCIVLGDVEPDQFPLRERERLARSVADAGVTLIVAAGKRFVPVGLTETTSDADPLRKLLPLRSARVVTSGMGFVPDPPLLPEFTPEGKRAWFLRLGDTPEQDRAVWESLPPPEWAAVGEPKDGAEVLATITRSKEKPAALIARQNYGFGRVLYVGTDSTWRWRYKVGDEHHHRFWKQAVQWAAADRLLPARNTAGTVRFGAREPAYRGGEPVEVLLRGTEAVPKPSAAGVKAVRLVRMAEKAGEPESLVGLVPLISPEGWPRELSARLRDLPPGRYAVEPEVPEWADHLRGPEGKLRASFEVLPPDADELTELTANVPLLDDLAAKTGGAVYDLADVDRLVEALAARGSVREWEVSTPLRRSWWTLALVALLLGIEWVVRKFAGLA